MTSHRLVPAIALAALAACGNSPPTDHIVAHTTTLVQYQSCNALEADLKDMMRREVFADIERADEYGYGWGEDASGDAPTGDSGGGREEGVDYSGTNNQVDGVDEADFVKTDGYNIYALNGNRLHIFGVPEFGQLTAKSVTPIEGHPRQMLIDSAANRAVVFSQINTYNLPEDHPLRALVGYVDEDTWYWRSQELSKITVLDITNRLAPTLLREVFYEGWYQTARKVDSSIRVAGYSMIDPAIMWGWYQIYNANNQNEELTKLAVAAQINAMTLADLIPQIYVRTPDGTFTSNSLSQHSCQSFYRPTDSHARGISSIISFDLLGANVSWDADHVVSNHATFYSSGDKILLAEPAHDWWWYWSYLDDPDQLNIHTFDISSPGKSRYTGSGRVDGQVVDQFSLDERAGEVRVATTTGLAWRWWGNDAEERPVMENHVWVLETIGNSLPVVGHIGGIEPGERIMTARFLADRAFLITFRQTDPLITLDLRSKTNPRVVGELEVPGFSTYLHPLADNQILSIGIDGADTWRTNISLFDVADMAHPTRTDNLPIEADQGWGWSEALYDHKAFQYWAPKQLLAVPQSNYNWDGQSYQYLSKLVLVKVDPVTHLSIHGTIDHSAYYNADPDAYWSYVDIRRSIFMGDYIYAISDKAISVHRTSDLVKVTDQVMPGYTEGDWYWWW